MAAPETASRLSAIRLNLLEDRLQAGTWSLSVDSNELTWSPGLYRILGLEAATVLPSFTLYASLVHPDEKAAFSSPETLASDGRMRNRQFRIIRADGAQRWLWSRSETVFDRDGRPLLIVGVVSDITEAREVAAERDIYELWTRSISTLLQVDFWKSDTAGNLSGFYSWQTQTNRLPEINTRADWFEQVHPDDQQRLRDVWRSAVESGTVYSASYRAKDGAGGFGPVHVRGMAMGEGPPLSRDWIGIASINAPTMLISDSQPDRRRTVIAPSQVRAGRAFLEWSAVELAQRAGVSLSTVRRLESGDGQGARLESYQAVMAALESAGLQFWTDEQGRPCMAGAEDSTP